MTTPDTSAVRAWARKNGYEVADRGRLPAEITDAYAAAQGGGARAPKPAKPTKAPSARTGRSRATPAKATRAAKAAPAADAGASPADAPVAAHTDDSAAFGGGPRPSRVADDRRLVALGEQLAALTERVAKLEKAAGSSKDSGKPSRFRRRS